MNIDQKKLVKNSNKSQTPKEKEYDNTFDSFDEKHPNEMLDAPISKDKEEQEEAFVTNPKV